LLRGQRWNPEKELLQPLFDRNYLVPAQSGEQEVMQITPEGERAIAHLWSVVEKSENDVLSGFSAQEKEQLISYLKRIQANCATITGA
jgi:DNA-binding MarR family transcriptional regulator